MIEERQAQWDRERLDLDKRLNEGSEILAQTKTELQACQGEVSKLQEELRKSKGMMEESQAQWEIERSEQRSYLNKVSDTMVQSADASRILLQSFQEEVLSLKEELRKSEDMKKEGQAQWESERAAYIKCCE
jgi:hypothetical protein